jgi:imidazole glycerol phosphate synthase subunit HisF
MSEVAIRVDVYQPKIREGKNTGLLEYVRQRTFGDVKAQFELALKSIDMPSWECNAFEAAEYISFHEYRQNVEKDVPKGELVVMARSGKCEGYRVELLVKQEDGSYIPIIAAKYLTDRDGVWQVTKYIDQACENGLYGC